MTDYENPCTTDLAKFGAIEREKLLELLIAWRDHGLPKDFHENEVTVMFNKNSGSVFLTNSEYQTAMMNGDTLESWYNCPECGEEGFYQADYPTLQFPECDGYCSKECQGKNE